MLEVCTATMQLPPSKQQFTSSGVSGKRRRTVAESLTDCAQGVRRLRPSSVLLMDPIPLRRV